MNPNRRFVYEILSVGLELTTVTPDEVLEHVTPEVLAHHLPVALKARLLQASLNAERMTAQLVIDALGVEALVEHAPLPILWQVVRTAVQRQLGAMPERAASSSTFPVTTSPSMGIGGPGAGLSAGPSLSAGASASGNGGSSAADDLQMKPAKMARPATAMRPPQRVSALSPRSRISTTIRRDEVGAGLSPGDSAEIRALDDEPARDFEIVEETDARQRSSLSPNDEDTRHGPKS